MKDIKIWAILFLCFTFAGCSPREEKIDGSVFIVTQGGENFKLGLVTVTLLDAQQVKTNFTKVAADLDKGLAELKQKIKLLNEENDKLSAQLVAIQQKYENVKKLADLAEQNGAGNRPEISQEESDQHLEDLRKMTTEYERLRNWSSQESETERDKMRQQFFDLPESYSAASVDLEYYEQERTNVSIKQALWDKWHPVCLTNLLVADKLHEEMYKIDEEAQRVSDSLSGESSKLENWPQTARDTFFANLPISLVSVKSDADGKFSVQLPAKSEFILAARAQRQVSDNIEKYFWLVRIHSDGKPVMQVMLSNDNLITENFPEAAFGFLIP